MSQEDKEKDSGASPQNLSEEDEITPNPNADAETEEEGVEAVPSETEDIEEEEEEEEVEFDLEAQVEEFRRQIEENPDDPVHHYNLGEALIELGHHEDAKAAFEEALQADTEESFSSIIHFALGNLYFSKLLSGIQANVVRSSVGLHSSHRPGTSITQVQDEDYEIPLQEFELAIKDLDKLKADEEIVDYVRQNAPQLIADTYYKWASDLIDKSRQIEHYGDEIKDVKESLGLLKKTLEINPNHSQASLMVKYAKKMLQEGWSIYDEYGFIAKEIQGLG